MVQVTVPGGQYTFEAEAVPLGLNNHTRDQWELVEHCVDTPFPFLPKLVCDIELIFRPK